MSGILTTNTVCVNNIEAKNDDDLTFQSEHKIILNTPNLLINNLKIDHYIENYLFNETNQDNVSFKKEYFSTTDKVDLTNAGSIELQMLDAMRITSYNSYTFDDSFTHNKNRQNYVNLISSSSVNINVPTFNEFTRDVNGYSDSVIYKNGNGGEENTLQNYIYNIVNFTTQENRKTYVPLNYVEEDTYDYEVTHMGEYFAKTIQTSNVSTFNISNNDAYYGIVQPELIIESESAINIQASEVIINGQNINDIIKASLDETYDMFEVNITPTNGLEISFVINDFASRYETFVYDVKFDIVDVDNPNDIVDYITVYDIFSKTFPTEPYTFGGLTEGAFYNIVSTVTNTFTNRQITNVIMSPNASNIVAIERENFTINVATLVDEDNDSISFTFVDQGFDVDSDPDLNYDYDIVFAIGQNSDASLTFNTVRVNSIKQGDSPTLTDEFSGLNKGEAYTITASITNNVTSIEVLDVYVTSVYLPSIPTLELSDSLAYNNIDRQFYVEITVLNDNGGFSIHGTPTLTDADYTPQIIDNSTVLFTFDNDISSGDKACSISIIDNNVGDPKTATRSKTYNLNITFANLPNVINLFQTRLLNYNSASVATIESYEWKKNDSLIPNETEASIIVNNENATYQCSIRQRNDEGTGFTRLLSASSTITLPEITNYIDSFNIIDLYTYTYQYTYNGYTYNYHNLNFNSVITINNNPPENSIPFSKSTGIKSCDVEITDDFGFFKDFNLGTFNVTIPTPVSGITFTNISPHSITVNWSNDGTDGNPVDTLDTIKLYYNTGNDVSNSIGDYVGYIDDNGSRSVVVPDLFDNTQYSFIIEKVYSLYGAFTSGTARQSTILQVQPQMVSVMQNGYTLTWETNTGTTSTYQYQIVRYRHTNVVRQTNITGAVSGHNYAAWRDYELDTSTNNKIHEDGVVHNGIYANEISNVNVNDIEFVSVKLKTDNYHNDLSSGFFWYYRHLDNANLRGAGVGSPIWFEFDQTQNELTNQNSMNAEWFSIKLHDGSHANNNVNYHDPVNNNTRLVTVNSGNNTDNTGTNTYYYSFDNYTTHGYDALFGNLRDIGIFDFYEGNLNLYFALINKSSDTSFGSLYQPFYKISSTTLRLFNTKVYQYGQAGLKYKNNRFVSYRIHNGTEEVQKKGSDVNFRKIMVYKDRITTVQHNRIPLVIQWLNTENGDIPWNGHINNKSPPIKPDIPLAIETGDTFVTLSWIPNPNNHGVLTHYLVNETDSNGNVIRSQPTSNKNNKHTFTELSAGTVHYFTVTKVISNTSDFFYLGTPLDLCSFPSPYWRHTNMKGSQQNYYDTYDESSTVESVAEDGMVNGILEVTTLFTGSDADKPTNLTGTQTTNSVSLSWTANSHNDAIFISYTVNREEADGAVIAHVQSITSTSYTWANLNAGQQYYFTVQKVTDRGATDKSNQLSINTSDIYGTNPGSPSMHSRDLKSVTFKWTPGNIGSGTLVSHKLVRYNDSGGASSNEHSRHESTGTHSGNITIVWPEDLEPDTSYYFRSEMVVNYSGDSHTITQSPSVFTFSYSKQFPSPAVMFMGAGFTKSSSSFDIGWRTESHGDYTLEKIVIHWVSPSYTYVSYGSSDSIEDDLWNNTNTLSSYNDWYGFSIQSEKKEVYPSELETYGNLSYVYEFVIDNPDNAVPNYTYDIVVEKVYSDLAISQYEYNDLTNVPVISRAFPYSTNSTQLKGIESIYATHTTTGSPRGIIVTIQLTGIETEVISSITYTKHPLSLTESHGSSPWTEEHVEPNPTRSDNEVYHHYFLYGQYKLVDGATYNLGAIIVTDVNKTYTKYLSNFLYNV